VQAAIDIGRLLRAEDAPLEIGPNQECLSACVLILAGATGRNVHGRVGIHRPYIENIETLKTNFDRKDVQKLYNNMTELIRSYLREMNVSDRLADDMMIVPPEQVRFLKPTELVAYGLGIEDPVSKENHELQKSKKLGINHSEYMRRDASARAICVTEQEQGWFLLVQVCYDAVLSGKHVERAPPCLNGAAICQPWERIWKDRKPGVGDVIEDGFLISNDR
jgi:hypothetical protein